MAITFFKELIEMDGTELYQADKSSSHFIWLLGLSALAPKTETIGPCSEAPLQRPEIKAD